MTDSSKLAKMALESGAIRLSPEKPFTWASGYKMPIYNDNRLLLGKAEYRSFISQIFSKFSEVSGHISSSGTNFLNKTTYFDYASTTPVDDRVIDKMKDCLSFEGALSLGLFRYQPEHYFKALCLRLSLGPYAAFLRALS